MIGADAVRLAQERFGLANPPEGPIVPRERLVELARALYDELGYHYLSYITAVHYPGTQTPAAAAKPGDTAKHAEGAAKHAEGTAKHESAAKHGDDTVKLAEGTQPAAAEPIPGRFMVVYRVRNIAQRSEFPFRCEVPMSTSVPSLCSVWAGADWQEREAFDLVGPVFEGHPDLRRIMLPEDWEGHPLQRQYAIDTPHRPWR
jgi:NADH:ubiquinone oxidoreductase subunit C